MTLFHKNYNLLKLCIKNKKNIFIEKPGLKKYSDIIRIKKLKHKNLNKIMEILFINY